MPGALAVGLCLGDVHRRQPRCQLGVGFTGNVRPVRQIPFRRNRRASGQRFVHRLDVIDGDTGATGQCPQRRHPTSLGLGLLGVEQVEPGLGFINIGDRALPALVELLLCVADPLMAAFAGRST